jgi:hypothetical protein
MTLAGGPISRLFYFDHNDTFGSSIIAHLESKIIP